MATSTVAVMKGLSFQRVLQYAEHAYGADGPARLLSSLSPDEQQALVATVPVGWYPLAFYAHVLNQLVRALGQGDMRILEDYGRFAARLDVGTVYKIFFKVTSPGLIFNQGMKLWDRFHNTGTWQVERASSSATGTLSELGCVDEALCRELIGYIEALLAHGNCKQVRVDHPKCRARGAAACVFTSSWQ